MLRAALLSTSRESFSQRSTLHFSAFDLETQTLSLKRNPRWSIANIENPAYDALALAVLQRGFHVEDALL